MNSARARRSVRAGLVAVLLTVACVVRAAGTAPFDRQPWLDDLEEARTAFATKYADLEWEVFERDLDLTTVFAAARDQIASAENECDARLAFERLTDRFGDKHVQIRWSTAGMPAGAPKALSCESLGYSSRMQAKPLAALLTGFRAVAAGNVFPAGIVVRDGATIGVIKVPLFMAHGFPSLCEQAIADLRLDRMRPCDDDCENRVTARAGDLLTLQFEAAIKALETAGAEVLLVDVAGNGGGSEWEGAASRMLTAIRLEAPRNLFVRGPLWAGIFADLQRKLRSAERGAKGQDRERLAHFVELVEEREKLAEEPCDASPLWEGQHPACTWLGDAFFSTGLLSSADPEALRAKSWGRLIFNPLQYPYHEGVWRGPVIVVVDGGTASAAEQFAAELQDNRAAVIMGSPTLGAGCGHTDRGSPTTLTHSRAVLDLPDCMRIRRNGSNLAGGVQPDILVGFRADDSARRRAALLDQKLIEALHAAGRLEASP